MKQYQDLVVVVRCKDCKYWDMATETCTSMVTPKDEDGKAWAIQTWANDFCSYGERREN